MLNFQLAANITQIVIGTVLLNFSHSIPRLHILHLNLSVFHKSGVSVLPFYSQGMC